MIKDALRIQLETETEARLREAVQSWVNGNISWARRDIIDTKLRPSEMYSVFLLIDEIDPEHTDARIATLCRWLSEVGQ